MTNMNKRNGNRNWKETSATWKMAEEIAVQYVGKTDSKTIRNVQLFIKAIFVLVIIIAWVIAVEIYIRYPLYKYVIIEEKCKYEECNCFDVYDLFGNYNNDYPFNYHCTVHEDGHNCQ